jgi:capsular polysaccharide biosynthesis protein
MTSAQIAEAQKLARDWLWKRNDRDEAKAADSKVVRPLYVRRKAQAMRSTRAFARMAG